MAWGSGDLDTVLEMYRRSDVTDPGSLGAYQYRTWRFARVRGQKSDSGEAAGQPVGTVTALITVRACPETRGWVKGDRLRERASASGLSRLFEIEEPGLPDLGGGFLTFTCVAGVAGNMPEPPATLS